MGLEQIPERSTAEPAADIGPVPSQADSCGGGVISSQQQARIWHILLGDIIANSPSYQDAKIPAFRPPADDAGGPDKQLASTPGSCRSSSESINSLIAGFDRSATAAAQPPKAAIVQPPWNSRRIVWDRQVQLRAVWLTVFLCVLAFFWAWRFQQFSRGPKRALYGASLSVAKACGNAMKIAIWPVLILPLSYVFTTPLRLTFLDRIVPFDYAVPFHMLVAGTGGLLAIVHTLCHLADYAHAARQSADLWEATYPDMPQPLSFWQLLNQESTYTGICMLVVLGVMFSFALPYPRKAAWLKGTAVGKVLNDYDWFWTSHKIGGGIFYVLLVLHPLPGALRRVENPFALDASPLEWGYSDTWVWVSIPILIRLADRGIRWYRRNQRRTRILGAEFMGDDTVALQISRPKGFHFRPGMYMYMCMPAIAKLQWHPISLAGSPSANSLAVLVRNSGNWATALHELLRRQLEAAPPADAGVPTSPEPPLRARGPLREQYQLHQDSQQQAAQAQSLSQLELMLDGPFGAPAVAYSRFPVVLLVGAGVGVTPFLSILADAVEQHAGRAAAASPPCSDVVACSPGCRPRQLPPVQKVHFHWLVREPTVPRWLRQTLQAAAKADASHLLDINVHLTKAASRSQSYASLSKALGRESMAADIDAAERAEPGCDGNQPAGSAVKAWHGRPDFEATLAALEQAHPGTNIGVFYCGPPGLRDTLSALCVQHCAARKAAFHFRAERF